MSLSTRQSIARSLRGNFGENSRNWKGADAGYVAIHLWVKKHFGNKQSCQHCGSKPPVVSRLELANISGNYYRIKSDWLTLCPSCHRLYDFRRRIIACPHGHTFTSETTYISPEGWRGCRVCKKESQRRYMKRKANHA